MSGTAKRLTIRSGRLRSSIVSANEPLVTGVTSLNPACHSAVCIAKSAPRSGSIRSIRGMTLGSPSRRRRDREDLDQLDEARLVDWLGHVVPDPQLAREVDVLGPGPRRENDHRKVAGRRLPAEAADQLVAVESWHLKIRDEDVNRELGQLLERLGSVTGGRDVEPGALEHAAHEFPHAEGVVDEHDTAPGGGDRRSRRHRLGVKLFDGMLTGATPA